MEAVENGSIGARLGMEEAILVVQGITLMVLTEPEEVVLVIMVVVEVPMQQDQISQ